MTIFRLLVEAGPGGIPAGTLAERLDLPSPTLSFHLARLERTGLAVRTRAGRCLLYSADFTAMAALIQFLTDDCCGGDPRACLPRAPRSAPRVAQRARARSRA